MSNLPAQSVNTKRNCEWRLMKSIHWNRLSKKKLLPMFDTAYRDLSHLIKIPFNAWWKQPWPPQKYACRMFPKVNGHCKVIKLLVTNFQYCRRFISTVHCTHTLIYNYKCQLGADFKSPFLTIIKGSFLCKEARFLYRVKATKYM